MVLCIHWTCPSVFKRLTWNLLESIIYKSLCKVAPAHYLLKSNVSFYQREEKELEASIDALVHKTKELKTSIVSFLLKLENEHEYLQWYVLYMWLLYSGVIQINIESHRIFNKKKHVYWKTLSMIGSWVSAQSFLNCFPKIYLAIKQLKFTTTM